MAGAALPRPVPPPPRLTCVKENTVRQIKSKLMQMLRSIEIEHLARDHFKIPLGATMPAEQIAAIEADHDGGSHSVNVRICGSFGTQPRDTLADAAGSIAHRAGVDRRHPRVAGPQEGQQPLQKARARRI